MPRSDSRKAYLAPMMWEARKGTVWEHRACSTPGCVAAAHWMIATGARPETTSERRRARFACEVCLKKKYRNLERRLWAAPEVPA